MTAKRQITFPSDVCDALGVKRGDRISPEEQTQRGERIWVLKPVREPKRPWDGDDTDEADK